MGKTKRQLQDEMDYAEFVEHRIAYELQPWGDDWVQINMVLQAILKAPTADFTPRTRIAVKPQTDEQLAAKLDAVLHITPEEKGIA